MSKYLSSYEWFDEIWYRKHRGGDFPRFLETQNHGHRATFRSLFRPTPTMTRPRMSINLFLTFLTLIQSLNHQFWLDIKLEMSSESWRKNMKIWELARKTSTIVPVAHEVHVVSSACSTWLSVQPPYGSVWWRVWRRVEELEVIP